MTRRYIYDITSGTWTKISVPEDRQYTQASAGGTKIVFGGGGTTKTVDVYDVVTNAFTTLPCAEVSYDGAAAAIKNKILIGGGAANTFTKIVDIYPVQIKCEL
jgi:hypothetical protein